VAGTERTTATTPKAARPFPRIAHTLAAEETDRELRDELLHARGRLALRAAWTSERVGDLGRESLAGRPSFVSGLQRYPGTLDRVEVRRWRDRGQEADELRKGEGPFAPGAGLDDRLRDVGALEPNDEIGFRQVLAGEPAGAMGRQVESERRRLLERFRQDGDRSDVEGAEGAHPHRQPIGRSGKECRGHRAAEAVARAEEDDLEFSGDPGSQRAFRIIRTPGVGFRRRGRPWQPGWRMREPRFDSEIYRSGYRRHFRPEDRENPFHALYEAKRGVVLAYFSALEPLRLVDVGGGYGRLAGPLTQYHDVTLCDISSEMLAEAGKRWPGLKLVHADARELPFDDGDFDAALALDLLAHLPDLEQGLRELARIVRKGGTVVFDTSNASPWWVLAYPAYVNWRPWTLLRTMLGGGVLPEWQEIVRHHRHREVRRIAAAVGLELERMRSFGPRWTAKWHLWWATKR
jgi:SAM-dependent methyltransferase